MSNQNEENTIPKADFTNTNGEEAKVKETKVQEAKVQNEGKLPDSETISSSKELEEAKLKAEENWNLFLRTRADMDNIRRRAQLDNENARKFSIEKFARELLVVVDSLEHGLIVAETAGDAAYKEGMALTLKLFLDILEKFDVKRLDPKGQPFDPNRHEAISMQENSEVPPNTILIVAQAGFVLNDRALRPARVVVSKAPEA